MKPNEKDPARAEGKKTIDRKDARDAKVKARETDAPGKGRPDAEEGIGSVQNKNR